MISEDEKESTDYIKSIYNNNIIIKDRTVIKPYELNIYIPEKRLAIEFNGNYWHSTEQKDYMYHQNKTIACAKQGIRLIHIFEYEWVNNKYKIKAFLNNIMSDNIKCV